MKYCAEHVFMIRKGIYFVIAFMVFSQTSLLAQQMAVGSWESHFSYAEGRHLALGNGTVFCAAVHGLFSVKENIVEVMDKNRGLSGVSISALNFFDEAQLLVIGYEEGIIDLVYKDHIVSIQTISNIEMITSKAINDFVSRGDYIYLSTDMGIALLDLTTEEISDFYSEIGPDGGMVSIQDLLTSTGHGMIPKMKNGPWSIRSTPMTLMEKLWKLRMHWVFRPLSSSVTITIRSLW